MQLFTRLNTNLKFVIQYIHEVIIKVSFSFFQFQTLIKYLVQQQNKIMELSSRFYFQHAVLFQLAPIPVEALIYFINFLHLNYELFIIIYHFQL